MIRIAVCALPLILLTGCLKTYTVVPTGEYDEAVQAHYVVLQGKASGKVSVYDCLSRPDGATWEPTCVRVDMRKSAPGGGSAPAGASK